MRTPASDGTTEHRLAPAVTARVLGVTLAGTGVLVLAATGLLVLLDLHPVVLLVPVALASAVLAAASVLLTRRGVVVRLTPDGYRVRWVRGAGVVAARWRDVAEVATASVADAPCVVLRLRDGRTTTIPVQVLASTPELLVDDVRRHLRDGQGLRPL